MVEESESLDGIVETVVMIVRQERELTRGIEDVITCCFRIGAWVRDGQCQPTSGGQRLALSSQVVYSSIAFRSSSSEAIHQRSKNTKQSPFIVQHWFPSTGK
jgi:hypothetical protein